MALFYRLQTGDTIFKLNNKTVNIKGITKMVYQLYPDGFTRFIYASETGNKCLLVRDGNTQIKIWQNEVPLRMYFIGKYIFVYKTKIIISDKFSPILTPTDIVIDDGDDYTDFHILCCIDNIIYARYDQYLLHCNFAGEIIHVRIMHSKIMNLVVGTKFYCFKYHVTEYDLFDESHIIDLNTTTSLYDDCAFTANLLNRRNLILVCSGQSKNALIEVPESAKNDILKLTKVLLQDHTIFLKCENGKEYLAAIFNNYFG